MRFQVEVARKFPLSNVFMTVVLFIIVASDRLDPESDTPRALAALLSAPSPRSAFNPCGYTSTSSPSRARSRTVQMGYGEGIPTKAVLEAMREATFLDDEIRTAEDEDRPLFDVKAQAPPEPAAFDVKELAGTYGIWPFGFFDPLGFTKDASEGKVRFYREVEIKHSRVAMLAAVGIPVGENFHPVFGDCDFPAYMQFDETPLPEYYLQIGHAFGFVELLTLASFDSPFNGEVWAIKPNYIPGDLGFDPLNLKPTDPEALKEMETKELNNGRLAMIATVGMLVQELVTHQKLR